VSAGSPLDQTFMALALRLAAKGRGFTSPNPMVGAVVVAKGRVIGRGYHRHVGGPHAEVEALRKAGRRALGATLYVSLEPCSHRHKRTPPCVPFVLQSRVRRVVIAMRDPNPRVRGRGIKALRAAGMKVEVGCLGDQAERLNESYCHWQRTRQPFVVLKAGMTLDGKIATPRGESQWITGEAARRDAHRLRSHVDAVLVGIGTVQKDDPQLTVRELGRKRQPLRIVIDSQARIAPTAKVLMPPLRAGTVLVVTDRAPKTRIKTLRSLGVNVLMLPNRAGRVPLNSLFRTLGRLAVTSILVEGGSEINAGVVGERLVNRVVFYVAPKLMGGQDAKGVIGGGGPPRLAQALALEDMTLRRVGPDLRVEGLVKGS
jgi:diaminohydroxyphosphoribosylaminopyrimidine deaminase/5-amino-6-(5-phosphoribosylamino)uracil reductase